MEHGHGHGNRGSPFHCSAANVPVVPGTDNPLTSPEEAIEFVQTVRRVLLQHVVAHALIVHPHRMDFQS